LKFEFRKSVRPHPGPLPQRERRRATLRTLPISVAVDAILRFVAEGARPPNAFISATRRRTIHPLLGKRAGVRASVPPIFLSPLLSNTLAQSEKPPGFHKGNSVRFGFP